MPPLEVLLPNLVHLGALLYLVCFLFRDQIQLRLFAIAGDFAYSAYYFTVADRPLWEAIFWCAANVAVNILMIGSILRDRRITPLSDDDLALFQNLRGLTPGQFRRLVRQGKWQTAEAGELLTREGASPGRLYYVLSGEVMVEKSGRQITFSPPAFIGELAYLRQKPATATVTLAAGAKYVSWTHESLAKLTAREESLGAVLGSLLNSDLAEKVARG